MGKHFEVPVAVIPIVLRDVDGETEILLHRRQNTGFGDGQWDFAGSGHVDEGESMRTALARELMEEVGLSTKAESAEFATISYAYDPNGETTYVDAFFFVRDFTGEPVIREPHKCAALQWFPLNALPDDLIDTRRHALENALAGIPFAEGGWDFNEQEG